MTCQHRLCCNPAHLVAKTRGENVVAAREVRRKDVCDHGHKLTPENTRWVKNRKGVPTWKRCRACHRQQMQESRVRG